MKKLISLISESDGKLSAKRILGLIAMILFAAFAIVALSAKHKIVNDKLALQIEDHLFMIIGAVIIGIAWNFKDYFLSKSPPPVDPYTGYNPEKDDVMNIENSNVKSE